MQLCCVQKSQGHQSELVQHREGLQDQASCKMFNISSRSFFTMLHCQIKLSRLMYIGKKKKNQPIPFPSPPYIYVLKIP